MWVPLIEAGEHLSDGANYFIEKYLTELITRDPLIDTIILGCTHYPLLQTKIEAFLSTIFNCPSSTHPSINIISQGSIVAKSLKAYLLRHPDIAARAMIGSGQSVSYLTTESANKFSESASIFLSKPITAIHIELK